ncbi:MAG: hypothetical protein EOP06_05345 [Proteobacteria bacterium]|nr:MAG: hypothetical protein EOP06_05345 [Pseudomonadota bacterium]
MIATDDQAPSGYRLFLLPGECAYGYKHVDFHNRVYQFWSNFWREVFIENGSPSVPDANIFYRQDVVAVITRGDEIVGTLFCKENNIASDVTCGISYFNREHLSKLVSSLRLRKIFGVATYEMLTVNPKYRKKNSGISFGTILLGVIVKTFVNYRSDILIGPVRLDNGVDKLVGEFGWELISEAYQMHGTPVAISALYRDKVKNCSTQSDHELIQRLWLERTDLRSETVEWAAAA